jgi:hypothetical protein
MSQGAVRGVGILFFPFIFFFLFVVLLICVEYSGSLHLPSGLRVRTELYFAKISGVMFRYVMSSL